MVWNLHLEEEEGEVGITDMKNKLQRLNTLYYTTWRVILKNQI